MIEIIFTLDYEIYGNGEGSLKKLVYDPTERLMEIFLNWDARFLSFIEVAELEMLEANNADQAIGLVKHQVCEQHRQGFELGLHIHPQWYNAQYENGKWFLDYSEYNLCTLPRERIAQIIERSIAHLRNILGKPDFTPLSFRAGNWLFQPTENASFVLADKGIKIDSSVFKGGLQHQHKLDYRRALKNGYYWTFTNCVNIPDPKGVLFEIPIYTQIVPFYKILTAKRIVHQKKGFSKVQTWKERNNRLLDFLRFRQPLKLDFCRMTINQLKDMVENIIKDDQRNPTSFKPIVAIGHTKDLVDFATVEEFLSYLKRKRIAISTFHDIYRRFLIQDLAC